MKLPGLQAWQDRLRQLSKGLSIEMVQRVIDSEPLTPEERHEYLAKLAKAVEAVDDAWEVLAKVCKEKEKRLQ